MAFQNTTPLGCRWGGGVELAPAVNNIMTNFRYSIRSKRCANPFVDYSEKYSDNAEDSSSQERLILETL